MAGEDRAYTDWLRTQPCAACASFPPPPNSPRKFDATVVHHPKQMNGTARRGHDHTGIPMHNRCHQDLHDLRGAFWRHNKLTRKLWELEQVGRLRALYGSRESGVSGSVSSSGSDEDVF